MKNTLLLSQILLISAMLILGSCEADSGTEEQCQSLDFCEKPVTFCIDGENEYYTYDGDKYDDKDNVAQAIGNGCTIAISPSDEKSLIQIKEKLSLLEKSVRVRN